MPAAISTTSPAAAGTSNAATPAAAPSDTATAANPANPWGPCRNGAARDARSNSRRIHGAAA